MRPVVCAPTLLPAPSPPLPSPPLPPTPTPDLSSGVVLLPVGWGWGRPDCTPPFLVVIGRIERWLGMGPRSSLPSSELTPSSFLPTLDWAGPSSQGPGLCDICIYCILLILIENKALFSLSFPPFFFLFPFFFSSLFFPFFSFFFSFLLSFFLVRIFPPL